MARRHKRSWWRRRSKLKPYLLIVLVCAVAALVLEYLYKVPDKVQEYAEERMDEAVRKAVKAEVEEAVKERQ